LRCRRSRLAADRGEKLVRDAEIAVDVVETVREGRSRSGGPDRFPDATVGHEEAPRVDEVAIQ
jgi:hypothetical protein